MADEQSTSKIHIDSDWKAEAQREKERLAKLESEKKAREGEKGEGRGKPGELPEASFRTLVGTLASQAIMGLGAMGDEKTGRVVIDLEGSRFSIDLLEVLEEKTKGNLTDEESKELSQILAELRARYVQISQLVAQQMAAQAKDPSAGAKPAGI